MARIEAAPRDELIGMVRKQSRLTKRYQRKLADVVVAYKDLNAKAGKLDSALEKQQEKTETRLKEQADIHKKELAAVEKLVRCGSIHPPPPPKTAARKTPSL